MNNFNSGDKVRVCGRPGTVIGHRVPPNASEVIIDHGSHYHAVVASDLELVPVPPKILCPWLVYNSAGVRIEVCESLNRAIRYAQERFAIVNVETGQWYDYRGREIER